MPTVRNPKVVIPRTERVGSHGTRYSQLVVFFSRILSNDTPLYSGPLRESLDFVVSGANPQSPLLPVQFTLADESMTPASVTFKESDHSYSFVLKQSDVPHVALSFHSDVTAIAVMDDTTMSVRQVPRSAFASPSAESVSDGWAPISLEPDSGQKMPKLRRTGQVTAPPAPSEAPVESNSEQIAQLFGRTSVVSWTSLKARFAHRVRLADLLEKTLTVAHLVRGIFVARQVPFIQCGLPDNAQNVWTFLLFCLASLGTVESRSVFRKQCQWKGSREALLHMFQKVAVLDDARSWRLSSVPDVDLYRDANSEMLTWIQSEKNFWATPSLEEALIARCIGAEKAVKMEEPTTQTLDGASNFDEKLIGLLCDEGIATEFQMNGWAKRNLGNQWQEIVDRICIKRDGFVILSDALFTELSLKWTQKMPDPTAYRRIALNLLLDGDSKVTKKQLAAAWKKAGLKALPDKLYKRLLTRYAQSISGGAWIRKDGTL